LSVKPLCEAKPLLVGPALLSKPTRGCRRLEERKRKKEKEKKKKKKRRKRKERERERERERKEKREEIKREECERTF